MGKQRSLASTAEVCGKSPRSIETLSSRFNWGERVNIYDDQFLVDTAIEVRKKNISRFQSFYESNVALSERAIKVSSHILDALETTVKGMDSPEYNAKINKVLSASKFCELLSRTVKNNMELHIGLTGLEVLAREIQERNKEPKLFGGRQLPHFIRYNSLARRLGW